ncbi:MAG: GNAT family N-acetyltransferase [Actinobacteria bacterium]|nr:GNAT family N-acetyltransferase [Actinomycetota bacterium]
MDVWTTDDPQAFLDRAGAHLAAEPVLTNVIAVVAERMTRGTYTWDEPWFATVEQDGAVVASGMHTAPNAYTGPGPDAVGALLAQALLGSGRTPLGVVGIRGPVAGFARTWATVTGGTARVTTDEGVHVLGTLASPTGVPGAARVAGPADEDLLAGWLLDFTTEAFADREPDPREVFVRRAATGVTERRFLLWEVDGAPVSLAGRSGPTHGVGRVGPVWTPPALRRRGYAAAATAAVTRALLDDGAEQVMLFTDLANPTSNGVYARLGYVQVGEAVEYTFDPTP